MLSPDQIALAAQQVSALEPIAGAGLAINLAYLALDRFRYRMQIEPHAEEACCELDKKDKDGAFAELDQVRELHWLARRQAKPEVLPFKPSSRGAHAYHVVFRHHWDIYFVVAGALLCGFTLSLGVALSLNRWLYFAPHVSVFSTGLLFYGCLLLGTVPAGCVWLGRKCVAWGRSRVRHCKEQFAVAIRSGAREIEAPTPSE